MESRTSNLSASIHRHGDYQLRLARSSAYQKCPKCLVMVDIRLHAKCPADAIYQTYQWVLDPERWGLSASSDHKMCDYALVRTRSALALSSPSTLVRTYSVPNLSVTPYYSSYYYPYYSWRSYWPYRYRDYSYSDLYSYDRYSYFSPTYYRSLFPYRRYYYSDYISNPYYWSSSYSYWSRYRSYLSDYDWPSYYNRWYDPYYDSYSRTYRYRSWLLDSMEDSLSKGLAQYRQGTINYNQLYRNWITSNDWHKRHKDWRQLYAWDRDSRKPEGPAPTHQAEWVPAIDRNP
ncbi:hypothetical protein niasHT_027531 [Heterodera trifolii]|uniref:Uncharacterized protein n=1 Tax=Heterodera trifolii TaxID=157864 RepID=A0ABD2K516_9BILA